LSLTKTKPTSSSQVFKKIRCKKQDPQMAETIASEMKTSAVVARVLAARGFKPGDELNNFISPTLKSGLPNPAELKNLDKAAKLIGEEHRKGGAVAICCDFDVDGLSGGSIVHDFFKKAGVASQVFVPDRFADGYGLNEKTVREIAEKNFAVLLTIDFGTTNVKELTVARELGLKTVVVDHHHISAAPPPADVFINPHQDGCHFAGAIACAAGLAWYLMLALRRELKADALDVKDFLDLACLGTICDMVPLVGMNRVIAKRGLERLTDTQRPGLRALRNVAGIRGVVGCHDVSFGIGPRLNAAGRMVHGELVVELLTTNDSNRADKLARDLNALNLERQETESVVKQEAIAQIERMGGPDWGLVAWSPEFHTGVIGIVAQRLVEHYYRPSAVMGMDSEGIFKGSVRGIKGFSVVEALASVREHLLKFGGHEGAGGFSVKAEKLEEFRGAFIAECKRRLQDIETTPYVDADTDATLPEITIALVQELKSLAPFGIGNPNPQVRVKNLRVVEIKVLKDAHLKVLLSDDHRFISGVMWRHTSHPAIVQNARVDIVFRPEISSFRDTIELQANLQAVEASA
jgi:single-stranded-DNA-specific exonuclease